VQRKVGQRESWGGFLGGELGDEGALRSGGVKEHGVALGV